MNFAERDENSHQPVARARSCKNWFIAWTTLNHSFGQKYLGWTLTDSTTSIGNPDHRRNFYQTDQSHLFWVFWSRWRIIESWFWCAIPGMHPYRESPQSLSIDSLTRSFSSSVSFPDRQFIDKVFSRMHAIPIQSHKPTNTSSQMLTFLLAYFMSFL